MTLRVLLKSRVIFWTGVLLWVAGLRLTGLYYRREVELGFAGANDTPPGLMIGSNLIFTLIVAPCFLVGLHRLLQRSPESSRRWFSWCSDRRGRSLFWTILCVGAAGLCLDSFAESVRWRLPFNATADLGWCYLWLAIRELAMATGGAPSPASGVPVVTRRAIIAFGANLGDRVSTIRAALKALGESPGVTLVATSPFYFSDPVGYADQPEFVNGTAAVDTTHGPEELLALLLALEKRFGRVRDIPNGPRTLDLDLLFYDGEAPHVSPTLTLPHPRWGERSFVTVPLLAMLRAPALAADTRWDFIRTRVSVPDGTAGLRPAGDFGSRGGTEDTLI